MRELETTYRRETIGRQHEEIGPVLPHTIHEREHPPDTLVPARRGNEQRLTGKILAEVAPRLAGLARGVVEVDDIVEERIRRAATPGDRPEVAVRTAREARIDRR